VCEQDFNVVVYHDGQGGAKAREIIREFEFYHWQEGPKRVRFNILVTSYELFMQDLQYIRPIRWKFLIIDEGHRLKNKSAKLTEALKQINCPRKLLMTGTPIQNNIAELFALLQFVCPSVFSSEQEFMNSFGDCTTSAQVEKLQEAIRPYMLRRLKEVVDKTIPVKEETIINIELMTMQKIYYFHIYKHNAEFLRMGCTKSNMPSLINIEMELRKCCNHPFLIAGVEEREVGLRPMDDEWFKRFIEASGKMVLLDKVCAQHDQMPVPRQRTHD
jgi:SNF2 family DNA or RNA helicase